MYGSECVWVIAVNLCINILLRKKQGSHGVAFKVLVGANGTFFLSSLEQREGWKKIS